MLTQRLAASVLFLGALAGSLVAVPHRVEPSSLGGRSEHGAEAHAPASRTATSEWLVVPPPEGWNSLYHGVGFNTIQSTSDGTVWLATGRSILRYRDGAFEIQRTATVSQSLRAISMVSPTEGWAAGNHGTPIHYDGEAWRDVESPVAGMYNASFGDIEMVSADDGWLCLFPARFESPVPSLVMHYDGESWNFKPFPLEQNCFTIEIVDHDSGWIGGDFGKLSHYDGENWRVAASPITELIHDIAMVSPTEGWAVAGVDGTILRYDGASWSVIPPVTDKTLVAIDFISPDEGWAVGRTAMHYQGGTWTEVELPVSLDEETDLLHAVEMVSSTEVWAAGIRGLMLRYGPVEGVGGPSLARWIDRLSLPALGAGK